MMSTRDLLEVADELLGGLKEAYWRSAVSRAYYAAFHEARHLLQRCGFRPPRTERAHLYLSRRLSNCGHQDLAHAGAELHDLRGQRNSADYDFGRHFDQTMSMDYVEAAREIVELFELAKDTPTVLSRITTAMQAYERDVLGEVTWQA